jgi:hypothetical protein
MMVTGGTSNKRIPQFRDAAASLDCAAATVLHMAQPWASNSGALASTEAKVTDAGSHHSFLLCFIMSKSCKARSTKTHVEFLPRLHMQEPDAIREKHRERRYHHNQGWNQRQNQRSFLKTQVHEVRDDECGLYER